MATEKIEIWGSEVIDTTDSGDRAKIGLVIELTTYGDYCIISTDIWFHSRFGVKQTNYSLQFNGKSVTGIPIDTSAYKSADGYTAYHDVYKVKLTSAPIVQTVKRTGSAQTIDLAASLTGISWVGSSSIMTVSKAVIIPALEGICKIHNGTSCEDYIAHIHDGDSYAAYIPYVHNGTSWEQYNG